MRVIFHPLVGYSKLVAVGAAFKEIQSKDWKADWDLGLELIYCRFYYIPLVNTSTRSSSNKWCNKFHLLVKGAAKNLRPSAIYSRVNFTGKLRKRSQSCWSIMLSALRCWQAALPIQGKGLLERKGLWRLEIETADGFIWALLMPIFRLIWVSPLRLEVRERRVSFLLNTFLRLPRHSPLLKWWQ